MNYVPKRHAAPAYVSTAEPYRERGSSVRLSVMTDHEVHNSVALGSYAGARSAGAEWPDGANAGGLWQQFRRPPAPTSLVQSSPTDSRKSWCARIRLL